MKRMLCLLLCAVTVISAFVTASAATARNTRVYRSADDTGAYIVRFSGKHADVERCASRDLCVSLDLQYNVSAACAYRGRVLLFCDDSRNNQLIVYVYYPDTDVLENFALYGVKLYANTDFCCASDALYIESARDNKELLAYSFGGNTLRRYRFNYEITDVFGGYRSGVYAVANSALYSLSGDAFTAVPGGTVSTPLFPVESDILASLKGTVYLLEGGRISRSFTVATDHQAASACVVGSRLYYPNGSVVNGYDIDTGKKVSYYNAGYSAPLLFADSDQVIAVGDSDLTAIRIAHFTELQQANDSRNASVGASSVSSDNSGASSGISSDVYRLDSGSYTITGIPAGTTAAQFKSNMRYSGYQLSVYRGNTARSDGAVGTAMTAVFTKGGGSVTFELGVIGDLTGEGSCNTRDLNLLMDHLLGGVRFSGVYTAAADVSGDGAVNAVDMAVMKDMI